MLLDRVARLLVNPTGYSRWLTLLFAAVVGAGAIVAVQMGLRLIPKRPSEVLAVVDGAPITVARLRTEMGLSGGEDAFATAAQRRALLDEVIRVEVLASNAKKEGYLDRADVRRAIDRLLADDYAHDAIDEPLAGLAVTEEEIQQYYRDHLSEFTPPRSVHVAWIFVAAPPNLTGESRDALRQRAEKAHTAALTQPPESDFGTLATTYSDDEPTRERGGDLGWVNEADAKTHFEPAVTTAITGMKNANEMSPVIETSAGFYLVKLLETRPAATQPLSDVHNTIRQQMIRDQREDRAAKIYAAAIANVPVSVNEAAVAAMEAAEESAVGLSAVHSTPNGS